MTVSDLGHYTAVIASNADECPNFVDICGGRLNLDEICHIHTRFTSRLITLDSHLSRSMLTATWATQPKYFGTKLDVNGCTWCTDINHAYLISQDLAKNERPMIIYRIPIHQGSQSLGSPSIIRSDHSYEESVAFVRYQVGWIVHRQDSCYKTGNTRTAAQKRAQRNVKKIKNLPD